MGSFFHHPTSIVFYSQRLWDFIFLVLEPWAARTGLGLPLQLPLLWDCPFCWLPPCCHHTTSSLLLLPISAAPTHLDEYVFFKSLVVRLPYSSIFWPLWAFFVLRLVAILMVVQGGKACLPVTPFWPEVCFLQDIKILKVKPIKAKIKLKYV